MVATSLVLDLYHQSYFKIMEGFFGIPHIANQIFESLTNQDLGKCKEVSQEWFNFIESEKILWKRIRSIHPNSNPYINGRNLLHIAAIFGQEKRFETAYNFSISMGKTNAQFVDNDLNSPLHYAAENGMLSICELIFNHADDKNLENSIGKTPLYLASENGHSSIVQLFIKDGISDDDCNPRNNLGKTPLYQAAKLGHLNVCQILIDKVEDKNPADIGGTTPLHLAAMNGHVLICELIIRNADNKSPRDGNRNTPLHTAAMFGHVEVTEVLLKNLEYKFWFPLNYLGITPLQMAKDNSLSFGQTNYIKLKKLYDGVKSKKRPRE